MHANLFPPSKAPIMGTLASALNHNTMKEGDLVNFNLCLFPEGPGQASPIKTSELTELKGPAALKLVLDTTARPQGS